MKNEDETDVSLGVQPQPRDCGSGEPTATSRPW